MLHGEWVQTQDFAAEPCLSLAVHILHPPNVVCALRWQCKTASHLPSHIKSFQNKLWAVEQAALVLGYVCH